MWLGTWMCQAQRVPCGGYTKKGGFLLMDGDHFLHLTDLGREVAEDTYESISFLQRYLWQLVSILLLPNRMPAGLSM